MPVFIDILNGEKLSELLYNLKPDAIPLWGTMSAQHMIEHLVEQVGYTNGNKLAALELSLEEALHKKQVFIYSDFELPKGALSHLPLNEIKCTDLQTAIMSLKKELETFHQHFKTEGITAIHGGFGAMNCNEWVIWHGKHFTHHFKQFGLWP